MCVCVSVSVWGAEGVERNEKKMRKVKQLEDIHTYAGSWSGWFPVCVNTGLGFLFLCDFW